MNDDELLSRLKSVSTAPVLAFALQQAPHDLQLAGCKLQVERYEGEVRRGRRTTQGNSALSPLFSLLGLFSLRVSPFKLQAPAYNNPNNHRATNAPGAAPLRYPKPNH